MTSGGKEEGSRRKEEADAGFNPAEKKKEADGKEERGNKDPPLYKKEEAVFASSFLFIATMSRL